MINLLGSFVLFFPFFANSERAELYETCTWKNNALTQRIVDEASNYCIEDYPRWPQCLFQEPIDLLKDEFPSTNQCRNIQPIWDYSFTNLSRPMKEQEAIGQVSLSSYKIPEECFFASSLLGRQLWPPETSSYYFCDSSYATKTCESMPFHHNQLLPNSCQMNNQPTGIQREANRPPCLDDRYISLTAKAFNKVMDCFGFTSKEEKEQMFSLFHVESFFLINKIEERAETGKTTNRCFAQLRDNFVANVNRYISFGDKESLGPRVSSYYEYGEIYKEAVNRCPFLSQALTPHPSTLQGKTLCGDYDPETKKCTSDPFYEAHIEHRGSIRCKTSQDPYSCLFYAIYNANINMLKISKQLKNSELNVFHTEEFFEDREGVTSRKIPLFKDEEALKWSFVLWAHNGGSTVITRRFPAFMHYFKDNMTDPQYEECETEGRLRRTQCRKYISCKKKVPCKKSRSCQTDEKECSVCEKCEQCKAPCRECGNSVLGLKKCEKYKSYRESLLRGESLTLSDLHKEFAQYAVENKIENHKEVSTLMGKITEQLGSLSNAKNDLTQALNHLHSQEEGRPSPQALSRFLSDVKEKCPITQPRFTQ